MFETILYRLQKVYFFNKGDSTANELLLLLGVYKSIHLRGSTNQNFGLNFTSQPLYKEGVKLIKLSTTV